MSNISPSAPSRRPLMRRDTIALAVISCAWVVSVLLVNPMGDFPLNDDWAYGWTVKTLVESGEFVLSDWGATNLAPQAAWGALFCLFTGFSFTALRLSTLVLGLLGVLSCYGLLREAGASTRVALPGALLLAVNPLYLGLSFSFNTDVPSLALSLCSAYLLCRGLRCESGILMVLGVCLSLLSTLNRQSGIALLVAFAVAFVLKRGPGVRTVFLAATPVAVALLSNTLYAGWLEGSGRAPALYGMQIRQLTAVIQSGPGHLLANSGINLAKMSIYIGIFLVPFVLLTLNGSLARLTPRLRWGALGAVTVAALGAGLAVSRGVQMPLAGNVLNWSSLGPVTVGGYHTILSARMNTAIGYVWSILTVLGAITAAYLAYCLVAQLVLFLRSSHRQLLEQLWMPSLHLTTLVVYMAAMAGLPADSWYDRYLIFPVPFLMALLVAVDSCLPERSPRRVVPARWPAWLAAGGLILVSVVSIAAGHDYMSWNRARWQLLDHGIGERGLDAAQIDGGFEFNGWYFGQRLEDCAPGQPLPARGEARWEHFACLEPPVTTDREFGLGFRAAAHQPVVDQRSFRRWLPWRRQTIFLLKRSH